MMSVKLRKFKSLIWFWRRWRQNWKWESRAHSDRKVFNFVNLVRVAERGRPSQRPLWHGLNDDEFALILGRPFWEGKTRHMKAGISSINYFQMPCSYQNTALYLSILCMNFMSFINILIAFFVAFKFGFKKTLIFKLELNTWKSSSIILHMIFKKKKSCKEIMVKHLKITQGKISEPQRASKCIYVQV